MWCRGLVYQKGLLGVLMGAGSLAPTKQAHLRRQMTLIIQWLGNASLLKFMVLGGLGFRVTHLHCYKGSLEWCLEIIHYWPLGSFGGLGPLTCIVIKEAWNDALEIIHYRALGSGGRWGMGFRVNHMTCNIWNNLCLEFSTWQLWYDGFEIIHCWPWGSWGGGKGLGSVTWLVISETAYA